MIEQPSLVNYGVSSTNAVSQCRWGRISSSIRRRGLQRVAFGIAALPVWCMIPASNLSGQPGPCPGQPCPPCYDKVFGVCTPTSCDASAYYNSSGYCSPASFGKPSPPSVPAPDGTACNRAEGQYISKCWGGPEGRTWLPRTGFPLNLSLYQGFGPSDYPPRKVDVVKSSSPLVSKEALNSGGPSPFRERPTLGDTIDLITGQPLLQETDFELPFGGAIFRHIRTYSENASQINLAGSSDGNAGHQAEGTFWDWNGLFWMMGENPILLIDLRYAPIAVDDPTAVSHATKRCYLIPDAHHAIPFIHQSGTQNYVAPAWFDAQISFSGDATIGANDQWIVTGGPAGRKGPSEFYVWLHRKSIKYTFKADYENLWLHEGTLVPVHNAPDHANPNQNQGGLGIPYYGLLTQIEDRYGNVVKINYCKPGQVWQDETGRDFDKPDTSCCVECAQECKGADRQHQAVSGRGVRRCVDAGLHASGFSSDTGSS
jgi:hypothetical protein